jgi:hypothetical protein
MSGKNSKIVPTKDNMILVKFAEYVKLENEKIV